VARQFVENAAEDLRIGNRMTFISELSYFSRLMTQDAHYEVAAIVLGHVHGVVGGDRPLYLVPLRAPVGDLDMSETLTANLGHERFSELVAKGALLSDEETIAAARECVDANYPITE
jgi:hypothetical protein